MKNIDIVEKFGHLNRGKNKEDIHTPNPFTHIPISLAHDQ
jgi:hypothetical protein